VASLRRSKNKVVAYFCAPQIENEVNANATIILAYFCAVIEYIRPQTKSLEGLKIYYYNKKVLTVYIFFFYIF